MAGREEDTSKKKLLVLHYNYKINENDFTNIDAFLTERCSTESVEPRSCSAELQESVLRLQGRGMTFDDPHAKGIVRIPMIVFRETGTEYTDEFSVDVRIKAGKKCVLGPLAEHKEEILNFMTNDVQPVNLSTQGYSVLLGRVQGSGVLVMIPRTNADRMAIASQFQLQKVSSTRFGQVEALLPLDFVKGWNGKEGWINKNPVVLNRIMFIVMFHGVLQGGHDGHMTSTLRDLKARLWETPRPPKGRGNRTENEGGRRRQRQRTTLHTFEDQAGPEFNLDDDDSEVSQPPLNRAAWRAITCSVFGPHVTNAEALIPMPDRRRCQLKHARVEEPVDLGRGKTCMATGRVLSSSGKGVAGPPAQGAGSSGKVNLREVRFETLMTRIQRDDTSPECVRMVCAAVLLCLAGMCPSKTMDTIADDVNVVDMTQHASSGVLMHVHPVIDAGFAPRQRAGLLNMIVQSLDGTEYKDDEDDEDSTMMQRVIGMILDDEDARYDQRILALAFVTLAYCTSSMFRDMCSDVESVDDVVVAWENAVQCTVYPNTRYEILARANTIQKNAEKDELLDIETMDIENPEKMIYETLYPYVENEHPNCSTVHE
jgi:hypothetical protein